MLHLPSKMYFIHAVFVNKIFSHKFVICQEIVVFLYIKHLKQISTNILQEFWYDIAWYKITCTQGCYKCKKSRGFFFIQTQIKILKNPRMEVFSFTYNFFSRFSIQKSHEYLSNIDFFFKSSWCKNTQVNVIYFLHAN